MASELTGLGPFERAALTVQLRRLRGVDLLQVMRKAESGSATVAFILLKTHQLTLIHLREFVNNIWLLV